VGEDRSRPGAEVGLRSLSPAGAIKPPPDRLYGRARGHALRPRQVKLLAETLPRLALSEAEIASPPSPLWLEIGFGGGEHAYALVRANPEIILIACEVFENGICSLLSRLIPDGVETDGPLPPNLRVWDKDARPLINALPAGCLDRAFLMFPDPWPKARHVKRRFVHPLQLTALARLLRRGGEWRIASDDPTYQQWTDTVLAGQQLFDVASRATERPNEWPPTRYEAKALRAGRQPVYWMCIRR
jgi:tRNA (guanine-N7-)-methyltransferase